MYHPWMVPRRTNQQLHLKVMAVSVTVPVSSQLGRPAVFLYLLLSLNGCRYAKLYEMKKPHGLLSTMG
jgi:hypothetical protein